MSYVEHGPRIFLAGGPSNGIPLVYGDYVLPRKRSEGRMKIYDSCSDIRAWSPNSLESSRYFRELAEHDSLPGKVVPFNVIIDSIIDLSSRAQKELHFVRWELQKYKSLELTTQQLQQLQSYDHAAVGDYRRDEGMRNNAMLEMSKSPSVIHSDSLLSLHLRPEDLWSSRSTFDAFASSCKKKGQPVSQYLQREYFEDERIPNVVDRRRESSFVSSRQEYADACLQVGAIYSTTETGVQTRIPRRELPRSETTKDEESGTFLKRKEEGLQKGLCGDKFDEEEFDLVSCSSQDTADSETGSNSATATESDRSGHKTVIIEKDSEIIALKNELGAKEAEVEELREVNKTLEALLKEKDENLNVLRGNLKERIRSSIFHISHEKLMGMGDQRNHDIEDLRKKLSASKYVMDKLKEDLDEKCRISYVQSQEIEKLRLYANEVVSLRSEKENLMKKVKEMERLAKEAESCSAALEQLKDALRERDQLQKQNREQSCILADQEDEIKQLLTLIRQMSSTHHDRQAKMKSVLDDLRAEIREKNRKISQCEEQLQCMEREVSELTIKLKNSLNNLEGFRADYGDDCNCPGCNDDIAAETQKALCNLNCLMAELQEYKAERRALLRQIRNLKRYIRENAGQLQSRRSDETLSSISERNLPATAGPDDEFTEQQMDSRVSDAEKGTNTSLYDEKPTDTGSEGFSNDAVSEDTGSRGSSETKIGHSENHELAKSSYECLVKELKTQISILSGKGNVDDVEKEIIEQASRSLIKMQTLLKELQVYVENERPFMIKQIHDLRQALKGSTIAYSQDVISQKQRICQLYNQRKEQYEKYKSHVKQLPEGLNEMQISQSIDSTDSVIYQQLEEILQLEEIFSYDEQVDRALAIHIKCSIDKIHEITAALQGAGDQRVEIEKEIARCEREIREKDGEIARLREEMAEKAEGDRQTDTKIRVLESRLQTVESKLTVCYEECDKLRIRNKDLLDMKNTLMREREARDNELKCKNEKINELLRKINESNKTVKLVKDMERKMEEMNSKLILLQRENGELRKQLVEAHEAIGKKDDVLSELQDSEERMKDDFARKTSGYEAEIERRDGDIAKLKDENVSLCKKLKDAENKVFEMNRTISSLNKEDDKINMIYGLQENVASLGKEKKRLETEIANLRTDFQRHETSNKKLADKLDGFLRRNEHLKADIERLKCENAQLSVELVDKATIKDGLRSKLSTLPQKIYEKIMFLRKQADVESNPCFDAAKKNPSELKKTEANNPCAQQKDDMSFMREINEGLRTEVERQIKEVECLRLKVKQLEEESEKSRQDETKCKLEDWGNDSKQKLLEIEKLIKNIDDRDGNMENLRKHISSLLRENDELRKKIEVQAEKYQATLMALKKKYDSGITAMRKEHKESIERLQARCEEIISDNENPFDAESWIKSLSPKQLAELHNRICSLNSCPMLDNEGNERAKSPGNDVNETRAFHRKAGKLQDELPERRKDRQKAGRLAFEAERQRSRKLAVASNAEQTEKSELQSQPTIFASLTHSHETGNRYRSQRSRYSSNDTAFIQADFTSQLHNTHRFPDSTLKDIVKDATSTPEKRLANRDTVDWQRKNFIYQCSVRALNK